MWGIFCLVAYGGLVGFSYVVKLSTSFLRNSKLLRRYPGAFNLLAKKLTL